VLLAAVVASALTARLGVWQLSRAAQKVALQTLLDGRATLPPLGMGELATTPEQAAAQHYRRVRLTGHWVPARTVFLDNRQMNDAPGFFVVTPLMLTGSADAVLVQRGWAPRDQLDRTAVPKVPSPGGEVEVEGVVAPSPGRLYEFSTLASGPIRQNLPIASFAAETGLALRPFTVLQSDSSSTRGDGLRRQWARPAIDVQMHYGYAFQWFALSALVAGLYVWYQLIRPRRQARREQG
jgi:surfeit locus 1 family protein